jgi:hypothetical protein
MKLSSRDQRNELTLSAELSAAVYPNRGFQYRLAFYVGFAFKCNVSTAGNEAGCIDDARPFCLASFSLPLPPGNEIIVVPVFATLPG